MATYIDALNGDHTDGSEQFTDWRSKREQLQDEYIACIVDGMDIKDLVQYAYDKLSEELDELTDEQLTEQVKEYYPDLLEND